jgi:hypothetical protein
LYSADVLIVDASTREPLRAGFVPCETTVFHGPVTNRTRLCGSRARSRDQVRKVCNRQAQIASAV